MPAQRPNLPSRISRLLLHSMILTVCTLWVLKVPCVAWGQDFFDGHTPIIDGNDQNPRFNGIYKNLYVGFLYGHWNDGSNTMDDKHRDDGMDRAVNSVKPRCFNGNACDSSGKIVVLGIGFSNWTKELCGNQPADEQHFWVNVQTPHSGGSNLDCGVNNGWSLFHKFFTNPFPSLLNPKVVFVDCAEIGAVAYYWSDINIAYYNHPLQFGNTTDSDGVVSGHLYDNCNGMLGQLGLSPQQVQVVLYKNADSGAPNAPPPQPPLAELPTQAFSGCIATSFWDACNLVRYVAATARTVQSQYPNVQQMFVHSRIYGGYAEPTVFPLNPEPFAYEQGLAMKWLIQEQVDEMNDPNHAYHGDVGNLNYESGCGAQLAKPCAPWIDWGAYLWASSYEDVTAPPPHPDYSCENCAIHGLSWRQDYLGTGDSCDQHSGSPECDFEKADNTHPSLCGRDKVSNMLAYSYCKGVSPSEPSFMLPWLMPGQTSCPLSPRQNSCTYPQQ